MTIAAFNEGANRRSARLQDSQMLAVPERCNLLSVRSSRIQSVTQARLNRYFFSELASTVATRVGKKHTELS